MTLVTFTDSPIRPSPPVTHISFPRSPTTSGPAAPGGERTSPS
jgi:hypothetical protein